MSVQRLMRQSCTVEPAVGDSAHGVVYGPVATVKCRVQEADAAKRDDPNRDVVDASTVIYLPYATNCPARRSSEG